MDGTLLMAHQNVPDARLGIQRVIQWKDGPAGVTEDGVDTQIDECLQHALCAIEPIGPGVCGGVHDAPMVSSFGNCVKCSAFDRREPHPCHAANHNPGTWCGPLPCMGRVCSPPATSLQKPASSNIGANASQQRKLMNCLPTALMTRITLSSFLSAAA